MRIDLTAWHVPAALLSSACSSPARDSPVVPEGLDVEPIAGLRVEHVEQSTRNNQIAFAGTLKNSLGVSVDKPSVTIFPITEAGRPIGVTQSTSDIHIPPDGEWRFETIPIEAPAADYLAFPPGALSK